MYGVDLASRLSQAWVHPVTDRASLLTDHRMSGLPILAKCKHFQTMRILQIILQLIQALSFCFDGRPNKGLKLETVSLPFYSPNRNNFPRIFEHVLLRHTPCFNPSYEQFDFLCIFGPSGCVPEWMYFSILHYVSHSVFCFAMMNLPWFLFCLPASVLFHWNVVRAAKWFLKSFFEFLKSLNHPVVDLHRFYRIGHLFSIWFKRCGHCAVAVLRRASMKFDAPIS